APPERRLRGWPLRVRRPPSPNTDALGALVSRPEVCCAVLGDVLGDGRMRAYNEPPPSRCFPDGRPEPTAANAIAEECKQDFMTDSARLCHGLTPGRAV